MCEARKYEEYKKLKIPKLMEAQWMEELFDHTKNQIFLTTDIPQKISLINTLANYGIKLEDVMAVIVDLFKQEMDTFSRLLLCEQLKQLTHWCKKLTDRTSCFLATQKEKMLNDPISIDATYKQLSYMSSYDFSESAIKKRITAL